MRVRPGRRPARRAGRLHRLQGPVRRPGHRPAPDRPAGVHRRDRPRRQADHRPVQASRASPDFDGMFAAASLAYTAEMQEAGVPVTFAYISRRPRLPRQRRRSARRVRARLDRATSTSSRPTTTRSVPSSAASRPTASTSRTRCSSSPSTRATTSSAASRRTRLRRRQRRLRLGLAPGTPPIRASASSTPTSRRSSRTSSRDPEQPVPGHDGARTRFTVHGDDAPTFYLAKKGAGGGALGQTDPLTRAFERSAADLTAVNQYTGDTDTLMVAMADQAEMKLLHMYTTGDLQPERRRSRTSPTPTTS